MQVPRRARRRYGRGRAQHDRCTCQPGADRGRGGEGV